MNFKTSTLARLNEERVHEGLRIPPTLDSTSAVNFVLTQEPGKLKPKDLKAAIERNRAEREQRAEEQKRLREEGGGAGLLDLRGILAEERLNGNDGDPFQRQLREMAFLADVEEVEKLEIEKGFRVSEDYEGSDFLSLHDINVVYKQRRITAFHKKRSDWRLVQERNHTGLYPPTHPHIKAGTSAEIAQQMLKTLSPHFDMNRNDVWSKRLRTLRRFVSLVSRWIVRKRVKERMGKVLDLFASHGAVTRDEVKNLIDILHMKKSKPIANDVRPTTSMGNNSDSSGTMFDEDRPASLGVMVFSSENEAVLQRQSNEAIIEAEEEKVATGGAEITSDMARRILFPECNPSQGGSTHRAEINTHDYRALIRFDDRTFFQLKVKPEYLTLGYKTLPYPSAPVYLPPCLEKSFRQGAPEENALRPPADANVVDKEIEKWLPEALPLQPQEITELRARSETPIPSDSDDEADEPDTNTIEKSSFPIPDWLQPVQSIGATVSTARSEVQENSDHWSKTDLNFFDEESKYRTFGAKGPRRCDFDSDWLLRPDSETLVYEPDDSLRTKWKSIPGFTSANIYLLGNYESRNRDPPPPLGPTLTTDFYSLDTDRHASGLSCFARDHLRGTSEWDPDIAPLQSKQHKDDYLTDSESDEEEDDPEYAKSIRPSMDKVRKILRPPKNTEETVDTAAKNKGKGKAAAPASPAPPLTNDTIGSEGFGLSEHDALEAGQRKEEQVELLRDRKTLDLESTINKTRIQKFDAFTERLCEISKKSTCLLQALPVQMPFHSYEEEVYKLMEPRIPPVNNHHVEFNARQSFESLPLGDSTVGPSSPVRDNS